MKIKKILKIITSIIILSIIYICLSISPVLYNKIPFELNKNTKLAITGHRGASNLAPENTIASIKSALKFNTDRIEIDVQQTLDSVVILMHDISLDRTTNGTGLIKEKTFNEISGLDAGNWFSNNFKNEKIPTLENVLELINGKCQLIIEIKKGNEYYPNIEKNVLGIIKNKGAEKWVIIHSFDNNVLKTVNQLNPNIPLHKLFFGQFKFSPFIFSNQFEKLDIKNYPYIEEYSLNYNFANRGIIKYLKANGKKVNVWTINDPKMARELISLGIDGIITDNPDLISN